MKRTYVARLSSLSTRNAMVSSWVVAVGMSAWFVPSMTFGASVLLLAIGVIVAPMVMLVAWKSRLA